MPGKLLDESGADGKINKAATPWWHTPVSASMGGSAGAYICFPFEGMKKRWQTNQSISFHPRELYRGSTPFAVSVTLATITQMSFDAYFKSIPGYN